MRKKVYITKDMYQVIDDPYDCPFLIKNMYGCRCPMQFDEECDGYKFPLRCVLEDAE